METKKIRRNAIVLTHGDTAADIMWAARNAKLDLELFGLGVEEHLLEALSTIAAKRDRTVIETTYLATVLAGGSLTG